MGLGPRWPRGRSGSAEELSREGLGDGAGRPFSTVEVSVPGHLFVIGEYLRAVNRHCSVRTETRPRST